MFYSEVLSEGHWMGGDRTSDVWPDRKSLLSNLNSSETRWRQKSWERFLRRIVFLLRVLGESSGPWEVLSSMNLFPRHFRRLLLINQSLGLGEERHLHVGISGFFLVLVLILQQVLDHRLWRSSSSIIRHTWPWWEKHSEALFTQDDYKTSISSCFLFNHVCNEVLTWRREVMSGLRRSSVWLLSCRRYFGWIWCLHIHRLIEFLLSCLWTFSSARRRKKLKITIITVLNLDLSNERGE